MIGAMQRGGDLRRRGRLLLLLALGSAAWWLQAQSAEADARTVEEVDLPYIRERFYVAVEEDAVTQELIAYIERRFSGDLSRYPPAVLGYYAALEGLRGKHDTNLLRKYRFVKNAIDIMEPLVAAHPGLLEVRFLRFSFYEQIPPLFGVRHNVPVDLAEIVEMLTSRRSREVPLPVQLDMIDYILDTEAPSVEQRRVLQELELQMGSEASACPPPCDSGGPCESPPLFSTT